MRTQKRQISRSGVLTPGSLARSGTRGSVAPTARTPRAAHPCRSACARWRWWLASGKPSAPALGNPARLLLQVHLLATPMTQGGLAPRRPHVPHPVHFFSEHGHEVTLAPDGGYDERQAEDTPRQSAWHLQGDQVLRTDPARGDRPGAPVEEASHPVGTSARIEPSLQTHRSPPD